MGDFHGLDVITGSEEETVALGRLLGRVVVPGDVVTLSGDLGAGKTRLVRGIAEGMGVEHPVSSPTFNILVVHRGDPPLNHFDLYRLERPDELDDIDMWETLESGGVSVIEWGDKFPSAQPLDHVVVKMDILDESRRRIGIRADGARANDLACDWVELWVGSDGATSSEASAR
jgi:tRNA threonylcarbamoyladenosine biosynthesis protein TsaE